MLFCNSHMSLKVNLPRIYILYPEKGFVRRLVYIIYNVIDDSLIHSQIIVDELHCDVHIRVFIK